jgi:hypothetical protein
MESIRQRLEQLSSTGSASHPQNFRYRVALRLHRTNVFPKETELKIIQSSVRLDTGFCSVASTFRAGEIIWACRDVEGRTNIKASDKGAVRQLKEFISSAKRKYQLQA